MELFLVLPDGACEGQNGHPHAGSAISGFRAIRGCLQGFLGPSPLTQQPGPEGRRSWARRADSVQQPPCPVGRAPHPPPAGVPREFLPHAISCPGRAPQPSATIRPQPGLPAQPDFTNTHTQTHTHTYTHMLNLPGSLKGDRTCSVGHPPPPPPSLQCHIYSFQTFADH